MTDIDAKALAQHWVHSHEEDQGDTEVYRPQSYDFPPSRGRSGLNLRSDGGYAESAPGPSDRPEERGGGSWELHGDALTLQAPDGSKQTRKVVSVAADRLVLRR